MKSNNFPQSRLQSETLKRTEEMSPEEVTEQHNAFVRNMGKEMYWEINLDRYTPSMETLQGIAERRLNQAEKSYELLQRKISP